MQNGDDKSAKNRIEKQVQFLKDHPEINSVGSNYASFTTDNPTPISVYNEIEYGISKIKDLYSAGKNCISNGTLLIKELYLIK